MRILVLTTKSPYPLYEGRALRTYNLLKQAARTHELYLLTFVQTPEELDGLEHLRSFCAHVDHVPLHLRGGRRDAVIDMVRELFGVAPLHAVKYRTRAMQEKMRALLTEHAIDVIHLDMLHLGEYLDLCRGKPVVLVEHNVESVLLRRRAENTKNVLVKAYMYYQYVKLRAYEARVCSRAHHVVSVSDLDSKLLRELSPGAHVTTIPNGVDTEYFQSIPEQHRENSLVFVGGLTWFPNLDAIRYFCAEVLPRVAFEIPDVSLTVVGKSPDPGKIRDIAGNPRVRLTGLVEDVRPWISGAAAYVVPLRIGGGTRLKILDALSMGMPLISTSVGCEGLEVEDGKHLLIGDRPDGLADAIVRVLRSPTLASQLGTAGRALVKRRYDWSVVGQELSRIYESCIPGKS